MNIVSCLWSINQTLGSWPSDDQKLETLPQHLARRLTPLGRITLQIVNKSIACLDNKSIPWVVSCRHGDIARRVNLLTNLAKDELLSPTEFSLSVHNAIIALFSIASGNKQAHSALAGGVNSFESGLIESIALHKETGSKVGFLYYDYLEAEPWTDQLEAAKIQCFAMILSEGFDEINLEYHPSNEFNALEKFSISKLINFFKSDEHKYRISIGGGEILFLRDLSKI